MKKIIVEQNGDQKEVTPEKLEEIQNSPDFQVEKEASTESEDKYRVKTRLMD